MKTAKQISKRKPAKTPAKTPPLNGQRQRTSARALERQERVTGRADTVTLKTAQPATPKKPARPIPPPLTGKGLFMRKNRRTPEEVQQLTEYIEGLIKYLDSLGPRAHDRALKKLTSEELFYVTWWTTYDNHQKGLRLD